MKDLINTIISFILGWFSQKARIKAKTRETVQDIEQKGEEARNEAKTEPDPKYRRD